jgi:hypothetical protein
MQNILKKSAILHVRELAKDKFVYTLVGGFTAQREILPYGEKNLSPCGNLSRTRTGLGAKRRTLYFLHFSIKNENYKILHRLVRKSLNKQ